MPLAVLFSFFFFNDTATTEIYTLSLHDALPISGCGRTQRGRLERSDRQIHPHCRTDHRDLRVAVQRLEHQVVTGRDDRGDGAGEGGMEPGGARPAEAGVGGGWWGGRVTAMRWPRRRLRARWGRRHGEYEHHHSR